MNSEQWKVNRLGYTLSETISQQPVARVLSVHRTQVSIYTIQHLLNCDLTKWTKNLLLKLWSSTWTACCHFSKNKKTKKQKNKHPFLLISGPRRSWSLANQNCYYSIIIIIEKFISCLKPLAFEKATEKVWRVFYLLPYCFEPVNFLSYSQVNMILRV